MFAIVDRYYFKTAFIVLGILAVIRSGKFFIQKTFTAAFYCSIRPVFAKIRCNIFFIQRVLC